MAKLFDDYIPNKDRAWIPYDIPFEVELRHMDDTVRKEVTDHASVRGRRKRGQGLSVDDLDDSKLVEGYAKILILNWKGIADTHGKDIPCDMEHKIKLLDNNPDFRQWVTECCTNVDNFIDAATQEDEKKLSVSSRS